MVTASQAAVRQRQAAAWVREHALDARVLVLAPSLEAGSRVLRLAAEGRPAAFGWQRATASELAARLGAAGLAAAGRTQVTNVVLEAVCARMVHRLRDEGALGRYAVVGERPGLPRALARTFGELALADAEPARMPEDLRRLYEAFRRELADAGLADRSVVLRAAIERARDPAPHPLLDMPLIALDLPLGSALDAALIAALATRSKVHAVAPSGDPAVLRLERALGVSAAEVREASTRDRALERLNGQLFSRVAEGAPLDESVELFSAPGESRECVEIARRVLRAANEGLPFDRMAVLTHAPERYRAHLSEALRRAEIPAHFSRGTLRPDPAGRALLALLSCKEERLSARAFAEYLSLGVVPDADDEGAPPAATGEVPWLAPDDELSPLPALDPELDDASTPEGDPSFHPDAPVVQGTLRAPWRWERLIVDAAVVGGAERWRRRLDGLAFKLEARREALEDPSDPIGERLERQKQDIAHLKAFALPLLTAIDALPLQASWGEWGAHLATLAERAIRDPARVLAVLRELAPMGPIGPVGLTEVQLVLRKRLSEMVQAPTGAPAGKLFVASIQEARGLSFERVFVPGLAEKVFPKKVMEDPIALDGVRRALSDELETTESRVAGERLALRLAIGAATERVVLSYPRLDTERGRPRVPSFYALEVLRAIEGTLPSFEELAGRAEEAGAARMAWPAPERPEDAIDGAEYDLAVLHAVLHGDRQGGTIEDARGAARYLMNANPHLARALRARFARWSEGWMRADGMVKPNEAARAVLAAHHPSARPYSATALEQLAACPYRFYLRAILRLAPREVPEAIEELDPRERGSLIHEAQARLLSRLRSEGRLPVEDVAAARAIATEVLDEVEAEYREQLVPAIPRVWRDAVEVVRSDLAEWIERMAERPEWTPSAFELGFGVGMEDKDPASVEAPLRLDEGLSLRGAIDLVEEREGALRATDHKTGMATGTPRVIAGGRVLQPVLYARALEALFPDRRVVGGRLYYCTSRGRFEERFVPLDDEARRAVALVYETLAHHLEHGFLPAAPAEGECARCDYLPVCGPAEERRVRRKRGAGLGKLKVLRSQP